MKWPDLPSPCYVVDEALIEKNLKVLRGVMERTGARILLAQKAFSMYELYPLIFYNQIKNNSFPGGYDGKNSCDG